MLTNLNAEIFKNNLFNTINTSGLQLCTAYYIMKDVMRELETAYQKVLADEQKNPPQEEVKTQTISADPEIVEDVEGIEDIDE